MSQIVTLYSDKEKTDALYPRTKVSAISDDNNTPLKELMTGMVKQEEGGTEEEVVTPINADTLGGKLTADNVVFYEEEIVDEFGQVVVKNADKLENHPASYFATSDELNTIITNGTLKMDLLWTNASPTSEFEPQTISLDLTPYKYALCEFLFWNGGSDYFMKQLIKNKTNIIQSGDVRFYKRSVTVNDDSIVFSGNVYADSYNVSAEGLKPSNTINIPYRIYGVR